MNNNNKVVPPPTSKKKKNYSVSPYIEPRHVLEITLKTGNIYESISIMSRRSNQISASLKEELYAKLSEFASTTDNLEEVHENKEQIEISRFYERLPHATLLAYEEFMEDKIYYRNLDKEGDDGGYMEP